MEQVPGFIGGDIIPSENRNAINNPAYRWPNGIVIYELDEAFSKLIYMLTYVTLHSLQFKGAQLH